MDRRKFIYKSIFGVAAISVADAFVVEPNWVEFNEEMFGSGNSVRKKIAQISDLHLSAVESKHREIAEKINSSQIDYIVFTGDSIDRSTSLPALDEFLSLFDQSISKVGILGNWEWWGKINLDELKNIYAKHNCNLLINESVEFEDSGLKTIFVGIDDIVGGFPNLELSFSRINAGDKCIVLSHCPEYALKIAEYAKEHGIQIEIILSGHTHGGQVNFFGFVPFLPQGSGDYLKGWYKVSKYSMYVSKGVGMTILPVRFGARPEVPIFSYWVV